MAEAAWPVGKTAQAATASRRAVTGSVPSMLRLSAASWRDRAMACWWLGAGGVVHGVLAGEEGEGSDRGQADDQGHEQCDEPLPPAYGPAVGVAAGVQEVTLGLAERRVAGGIGADPGGGAGRGLQQAAAVEVGPVAGVAGPLGGGGVQPGADDPVGVGVGEPGVAQQRPGGQQRLVAEFHGAGGQGKQPFGGEGLQHRLHILGLGWALARRSAPPWSRGRRCPPRRCWWRSAAGTPAGPRPAGPESRRRRRAGRWRRRRRRCRRCAHSRPG